VTRAKAPAVTADDGGNSHEHAPPRAPKAPRQNLEEPSEAVGRAMADRLVERGVYLPVLMTVEHVANLLCVVPRVVRRAINRGTIPAVRFGRRWMIPRRAFLKLANARAVRQMPAIARERAEDRF
jgi:excisionase family DNA binding protein